MARTFPAALAVVVALTGTALPAAAAPAHPTAPTSFTPTGASPGAVPRPGSSSGSGWSIPLTGVAAGALVRAPSFSSHAGHAHASGAHSGTEPGGSVDVPTGRLAALSPQTRTESFTLAAVSWLPDPEDEVTSVAVRVREGGSWSEWFELGVTASDEPDARIGSEPVLAPGADGVQARVETVSGATPDDLRIELVQPAARAGDAGIVASAAAASRTAPTADGDEPPAPEDPAPEDPAPEDPAPDDPDAPDDGAPDDDVPPARPKPGPPLDAIASGTEIRPHIVTRAQWGADESLARDSSRSTTLKAMYVHHTVNANTYTAEQAPGIVRSILQYHAGTLGWPDVGYQFLVDRFGTIYEGRRGAIDELVVGAQAGGYNTDTIGVSAIGNFHPTSSDSKKVKAQKQPPDAMVQSIIDVLAWQAHAWNVKPKTKVRLLTGGSTGSGTRWRPGQLTDKLPRIRGHRDTNYTACPGSNLYDLLPYIRDEVAYARKMALATYGTVPPPPATPVTTTLTAKQTPVRLASRLPVSWQPVPGAAAYQVLVRRAKHGKAVKPAGGAWRRHLTTTATSVKLPVPKGATWTVGVRAVDANGRTGMTRIVGTTTRPVGSAKLERSKGAKKWKKVVKKNYYRKRAFTVRKKNATITVKGARDVRQVWIVAPSGPKYGKARLSVGGTDVGTVSFTASTYTPKRRIAVVLPRTMSGDVVLTTQNKKLVRISAIAFARR